MSGKTHGIEVDEATATALRGARRERGLTVPDLLSEFASAGRAALDIADDQVAELDRRWLAVQGDDHPVPHDQVVRWLESVGARRHSSHGGIDRHRVVARRARRSRAFRNLLA